jgi:hypothetical protein
MMQEHLDDDQVLDWLAQAEVQVELGDGAAAAAAAAGPGKELPLWFRGTGELGVRLGGWFEPCHVAGAMGSSAPASLVPWAATLNLKPLTCHLPAESESVGPGGSQDLPGGESEQQRGGEGNAEEQRRVQEAFLAQYLAQVQAAAASGQAGEDLEGTEPGAPGKPWFAVGELVACCWCCWRSEVKCGVHFGLLMIAMRSSSNS